MTMLCGWDFLHAWLKDQGEDLSEGLESILNRYPNICVVSDDTGRVVYLVQSEGKSEWTVDKVLFDYFGQMSYVELSKSTDTVTPKAKKTHQTPFWANDWRNKRKKR